MTQNIAQQQWFDSALGRYVLAQEQLMFDMAVNDVFGYHAVQLGLPQLNTLNNSRITHLIHANDIHGNLNCDSDFLPFAENTIDLVCLPHAIELSENPHQTLREAERVLVPEGHLMMTGFNPVSAWGLKHVTSQKKQFPWQGDFFSLIRIKDWLALLGLEFVSAKMVAYALPISDEKWLNRMQFMDKTGVKWWPMFGGVYFIVAKKRVANIALLKPNWKKNALKSGLIVNVPKNKPTQRKSTKQLKSPVAK